MGTLIKNGVNYSGSAVIVDNLNASTGTDTALSAKQGNLLANDLGPIEPNDTSAHAYNVGDLFIWKSQLVKVTASIAVGNTITLGTNVSAISVAEQFEGKADKVTNPTNGNLAKLDSSGNLADSGIASDIFPSGASSSDKLVKASENNFKYINLNGDWDFNDLIVTGVRSVHVADITAQNSPPRTGWFQVYTSLAAGNSNYVQQLAVFQEGDIYVRVSNNGTWYGWTRLVKETELPVSNITGNDGTDVVYGSIAGLAAGQSMFVAEKNFSKGLYIINIWVNVLNCTATDFPFLMLTPYANGQPLDGSSFLNGTAARTNIVVPIIGNGRNWNEPIFASSFVWYVNSDNVPFKLSVTNATGQTISPDYDTSYCGYRYYKIS